MTTAQVVETSVNVNNSPFQHYVNPDDHGHPTYRAILKKKGGKKKTNSPVFYTELDLSWNRAGLGARGGGSSLFYINHYKFLKIHKLKIDVAFSVFWW